MTDSSSPEQRAARRPGAGRDASSDTAPHDRAVVCPFCHSREVELFSLFGSQLSTDQYYCRACHTPFERFNRDTD